MYADFDRSSYALDNLIFEYDTSLSSDYFEQGEITDFRFNSNLKFV